MLAALECCPSRDKRRREARGLRLKQGWKMKAKSSILIAVMLLAIAFTAQGQPAKRVAYLAGVSTSADAPRLEAFRQALRAYGHIEGQNILIETRHESSNLGRLSEHAAELVAGKPDVFVAVTTNAALAAKKVAGRIPVVFMGVTDPVGAGLVESLARPGGNVTGVTNMAAILTGKRLELLKEAVPKVSRVAVLWDPKAPGSTPQWEQSQQPAQALGMQLYSMEVSSVDRYEPAFKEAVNAQNTTIWVTLNPLANSNQKVIADLAIKYRLPSICARSDYADNGCLIAYGPGYSNEGKDSARYVDKILKGTKPADIPVEQPTKFELVINLKTAKALGLTIPQSVLLRADQVIQ
jgi:putative ABC transport system substrate-binding protein